jgi:hypothetical protein
MVPNFLTLRTIACDALRRLTSGANRITKAPDEKRICAVDIYHPPRHRRHDRVFQSEKPGVADYLGCLRRAPELLRGSHCVLPLHGEYPAGRSYGGVRMAVGGDAQIHAQRLDAGGDAGNFGDKKADGEVGYIIARWFLAQSLFNLFKVETL